ncbi:PTS N-acetylgalactosamine transporter subunit IIC [Clostridium tarantellae]|uniref:PTS N-acetylgalactosamine transporter subunit IIC n=1 Tax=Clostridium tarantellae TaxID=39493 RepID=A0A6I1MN90_9CLOT|nr:PTS N-acetylgalactosamine transporter subunit IIC [Clostridium tarantellae]MPQ44875.1 PTS N-acetylgalactosamine transporter subunit IIC [Clostridium tarantellae]
MLIQALLIALWAGLAGVDMFDGLFHIHRPIVTGFVVGLILGDMKTGLIVGGTLELVWMGMVPLAGAQPPNVVIGGIIGTTIAILADLTPTAAIGFAIPFAIATQACITLLFTAFSLVMNKADKYAQEANYKGIERINYLGVLIVFLVYFVIAFLPVYFGAEEAKVIVEIIPQKVIDGLAIAGGMMPAIGFAMLLKIMLKKEYIAFLALGFTLAAYAKFPILGIAIIGGCIALYDYYSSKRKEKVKPIRVIEEEDFSDGI